MNIVTMSSVMSLYCFLYFFFHFTNFLSSQDSLHLHEHCQVTLPIHVHVFTCCVRSFITCNRFDYYIAGSASRQDEANPVF